MRKSITIVIMFPLLDLDDDAIAATLGFTDPRSLCSATMTCRRLRRLADATWVELDRNLAPNKRKGGSTPRERVLSSFIVHVGKERISGEVITRKRDWEQITPTELATRNYLLYLHMSKTHTYYDSFIGSSVVLNRDEGSVDLPLYLEHTETHLGLLLSILYDQGQWQPGLRTQASVTKRMKQIFTHAKITIFAFDRRTLYPRILFDTGIEEDLQRREGSLPLYRLPPPSVTVSQLLDGSNRVEVKNNWVRKRSQQVEFQDRLVTKEEVLEIGLYFQKHGSFGLVMNRSNGVV